MLIPVPAFLYSCSCIPIPVFLHSYFDIFLFSYILYSYIPIFLFPIFCIPMYPGLEQDWGKPGHLTYPNLKQLLQWTGPFRLHKLSKFIHLWSTDPFFCLRICLRFRVDGLGQVSGEIKPTFWPLPCPRSLEVHLLLMILIIWCLPTAARRDQLSLWSLPGLRFSAHDIHRDRGQIYRSQRSWPNISVKKRYCINICKADIL